MMSENIPPVVYHINSDDIIEDVNDAWVQFAIENNSPSLSNQVIGRSLWNYIAGLEVSHIYHEILQRVRTKNVSVSFAFRCDSPQLYRAMRLLIVPQSQGRIEFRAVLEAASPHSPPIELLQRSTAKHSQSFLRMCSWCKAVAVDHEWWPIEKVVEQHHLFLRESIPDITHGICDACLNSPWVRLDD